MGARVPGPRGRRETCRESARGGGRSRVRRFISANALTNFFPKHLCFINSFQEKLLHITILIDNIKVNVW